MLPILKRVMFGQSTGMGAAHYLFRGVLRMSALSYMTIDYFFGELACCNIKLLEFFPHILKQHRADV